MENLELIATEVEIKKGRVTGKLASPNCHGAEKARRIKTAYRLADFTYIYAYGDSRADDPMFELADEYFYRTFTGR